PPPAWQRSGKSLPGHRVLRGAATMSAGGIALRFFPNFRSYRACDPKHRGLASEKRPGDVRHSRRDTPAQPLRCRGAIHASPARNKAMAYRVYGSRPSGQVALRNYWPVDPARRRIDYARHDPVASRRSIVISMIDTGDRVGTGHPAIGVRLRSKNKMARGRPRGFYGNADAS